MNQVFRSAQKSIEAIREVSCDLYHPLTVWLVDDPGNVDSTTLQIHEEQDMITDDARERQNLDCEEITSRDSAPVSLQKRAPGHTAVEQARCHESVGYP